jgi:Putative auto-transporter adhesin, head GIN domain
VPKRRLRVLVVIAVLLGGCTINIGPVGPSVQGSGHVITESREVSDFDEVVVMGSGDVVIDVNGTESLEIEAEDNILPLLTSDVVDGRLELGSSGSYSTSRGVRYTITAAMLSGVTVSGSGDVTATGIDGDPIAVRIEGSGNVTLVGTTAGLTVDIEGSGNVEAFDLEATTATVRVDGSGNADVTVVEELAVTINGSGNVVYDGSPTVDESINGSGDVRRR